MGSLAHMVSVVKLFNFLENSQTITVQSGSMVYIPTYGVPGAPHPYQHLVLSSLNVLSSFQPSQEVCLYSLCMGIYKCVEECVHI